MGRNRPLFALFLFLLPSIHGSEMVTQWRSQGCKTFETPCVCSGEATGRTIAGLGTNRLDTLRDIYQNCSRVYGNVEITHLYNVTEEDLDFLDDIEEVKGYIMIYMTDLRRIRFRNLRIIWGDSFMDDTWALFIANNDNLEEVSMPALRSVHQGRIGVENSPKLCYFAHTVNIKELVGLENNRSTMKYRRGSCKMIPKCHESCNGACWGPLKEDCQSLYRNHCPSYCESRMCYTDEASETVKCCDSQCVAGCVGPKPSDCYACSRLVEDGKCTQQCTSLTTLDRKSGMMVPNPEGYYTHDRYCVKKCPENLSIMGEFCVKKCSEGYYEYEGSKVCKKCDGECPNTCTFTKDINSVTIRELQNCTKIEGHIRLVSAAFKPMFEEGHGQIPALRVEDLDVLKSVKVITDFVYVAVEDSAPMATLDFLENVEIIQGRQLLNTKQSLIVSLNDNLVQLGLRRLREISKGDVVISSNFDLCFTDTIDWKSIVNPNNNFNVKTNANKDKCIARGSSCDHSCDPAAGCWGSGPRQCVRCMRWRQKGECVEHCAPQGFYENSTARECQPCPETCLTCTGPTETECTSCRNVTVYRQMASDTSADSDLMADEIEKLTTVELLKTPVDVGPTETPHLKTFTMGLARWASNLSCFDRCPIEFYEEEHVCKRCDHSCIQGCSGPANTLGIGGCNRCRHAEISVENGTYRVDRCLYNPAGADKLDVCKNNRLEGHFYQVATVNGVDDLMCTPCNPECASCTSLGNSPTRNGCECRNFRITRMFPRSPQDDTEICMSRCPRSTYLISNRTEESVGHCGWCHHHCSWGNVGPSDPVCSGPKDTECTACITAAIRTSEGMRCIDKCPEGTFLYSRDKHCYDVDYDARYRYMRWTGALLGVFIGLVFVLCILVFVRRCLRYKKELAVEKAQNMPEFVETIPIDSLARPNMERLNLIARTKLVRSTKLLGSGAFGEVYAGCWIPPTGKNVGKNVKVPVAIKVVKDPSGRAQAEMLEEATKMAMMRHEHLLRIVGVCLSGSDLQLVTLLRPLGNLLSFMQKHKQHLGGKDILLYSHQIASGMKYLSEHRLVHRDLAARNVLVKNSRHVEITDFGLAKMIDYGCDNVLVDVGKVAPKWLAIEALESHVYNTSTDVWAFGVTCWELLTYGESPYMGMNPHDIKDYLLDGKRLRQPGNCSTTLYQALLQCWLEKPDSRPTFAVLKDQFLNFCRAPHLFVTDTALEYDLDLDECQRDLIAELIDDKTFEDPQEYQFHDTVPPTPDATQTQMPRNIRLESNNSQRYHPDPRQQFGMSDDNYLVPNPTKASGVPLYTPVVVNEHGETALVNAHDYYNETDPTSDYQNEMRADPKKKAWLVEREKLKEEAVEEEDLESAHAFMQKESCL